MDEIEKALAKKKQDTMDKKQRLDMRAKMPVRVQSLATGEYIFVGATKEDVEDNPKLIQRFDNEVIKTREQEGDTVGFIGAFVA